MKRVFSRMKWFVGVVAVVAAVVANIDNIGSFAAKWIVPLLGTYINPRATISVALDSNLTLAAYIFVADPGDATRAIAVARASQGQAALLDVPANIVYKIGWQGTGLEAGAADQILAVKGESEFRLVRIGEVEGQVRVGLRRANADQTPLLTVEPSAKLLLSARAAQAVVDPKALIVASALPEVDRALAIVGIFETGTTECARKVSYAFTVPPIPTTSDRGLAPSVGCLAASVPGWLVDIVNSLDAGEPNQLDLILGEDAAAIRTYVRNRGDMIDETALRRAMSQLTGAPEFWISYQTRALAAYRQATEFSRRVGLTSERGRLLILDRLIASGASAVSRAVQTFLARYSNDEPNRPKAEAERIRILGQIFKEDRIVSRLPGLASRVDTIANGVGSIRGIKFDFDQLGILDAD